MTLGCKDIWIRKSEFVAKTQILYETSLNFVEPFMSPNIF